MPGFTGEDLGSTSDAWEWDDECYLEDDLTLTRVDDQLRNTRQHSAHAPMPHTLMLGRWGSTTAAKLYLQDGLQRLEEQHFSSQTLTLIEQYVQVMLRLAG